MFQFDDTYWSTSAYTWYIYGQVDEYPEITDGYSVRFLDLA
jgi:hypothetical protein